MSHSRKIELICGLLSAFFASIVICAELNAIVAHPNESLPGVLIYLGIVALVAVGAGLHAVKGKRSGFVMLLFGGSLLTVQMLLTFPWVFVVHGVVGTVFWISPNILALITMITALISRQWRPTNVK